MNKSLFTAEQIQDLKREFVEFKLNENFTRDQFYKEFGNGSTFPQLVVDGQKTGGCNESISHFKSRGII